MRPPQSGLVQVGLGEVGSFTWSRTRLRVDDGNPEINPKSLWSDRSDALVVG